MQLLFCFISIMLGSFLLFLIQPLSAKELLPYFGGSPAVWNVCMVFFQGILLLGYFYVFLATRFLKFNLQCILHFTLIVASFTMLPILWQHITPQLSISPEVNIFWLLCAKLSIPLLMVSTTSPLIQYWFSQSKNSRADNPYFLYSASNIGSLGALMSFPFLLEPFFGLQSLSRGWSVLFALFGLSLLITAVVTKPNAQVRTYEKTINLIPWSLRLKWLVLSFAPSSLLISVTQYISTDIAAIPFLWILPLSIYLLVFIIVFASKPLISHQWMLREQSLFLIFPLISLSSVALQLPSWICVLFHMIGFFALVMVCLGELVTKKPDKNALSEFYLWIAFGGFLGGIFTSIFAPLIFKGAYEYHIAFCLCLLLRPWQHNKNIFAILMMPIAIAALLTINYYLTTQHYSFFLDKNLFLKWIDLFLIITVITIILANDKNTLRLGLNVAVLFAFSQAIPGFKHSDLLWQSRNFFGVSRVYKNDDHNLHFLLSGTTLHGLEALKEPISFNRSTSYYSPIQPITDILYQNKSVLHIGIAGLGTGVLQCEFHSADEVSFFEINPQVIQIANNSKFFNYLKSCPTHGSIELGDARLSIAKSTPHSFDALIIDAFNSDSIPVHLLTQQAIGIYLDKLTPEGILIFNVSNRHFNLDPVLTGLANQFHLYALRYASTNYHAGYQFPSEWIILTRNKSLTQKILANAHWKLIKNENAILWTDDFSNIFKVLK